MHLIEQRTDGVRTFLSLTEGRKIGHRTAWTPEAEKALQFVRNQDAQDFIDTYFPNIAPELYVAEVK